MSFPLRFLLSVLLVLFLAAVICGIFYLFANYTMICVGALVVGVLALLITLSSYEDTEA